MPPCPAKPVQMNEASRGARRGTRKAELRALLDDQPADIQVRAEQLRGARGDLPLADIAGLARELADPPTAAVADIAVCLLCDRVGVTIADAKAGAQFIVLEPVTSTGE